MNLRRCRLATTGNIQPARIPCMSAGPKTSQFPQVRGRPDLSTVAAGDTRRQGRSCRGLVTSTGSDRIASTSPREGFRLSSAALIGQQIVDHHDRCRTNDDYEHARKDEENQRDDHLDRCLLGFLFGHLSSFDSHGVRLNSQRLSD